jgi:ParB family chromosome partitioning protein
MAKKVKKRELGMGIRALLTNMDDANTTLEEQVDVVRELAHSTAMIPVNQIEVNPYQPRKEFDETALQELSDSIRIHGLIQPITLRRLSAKEYQLISGERRLRASKLAGLEEVPAYIRLANDQEMIEMALVENIQREDLNPVEVAITYQRLIDECNLTHELMAERVGKKRSTISNFLGLLRLPPQLQSALKDKRISMGHAKALGGIEDIALQISLFQEIVAKGLSVRDAEELVRRYNEPKSGSPPKRTSLPDDYQHIQDLLSKQLGSKVHLKLGKDGKGQININFHSDDDLNRLLDQLDVLV